MPLSRHITVWEQQKKPTRMRRFFSSADGMRADEFCWEKEGKCETSSLYYLTIPHFDPKVKSCISFHMGVLNIQEVFLWKELE